MKSMSEEVFDTWSERLSHVMKISKRKYYQYVCNRDVDIVN